MKKILGWFGQFLNRKDTKEIARERLEFLISRDRDQTVEEKAKEIKGKIEPAISEVAEYIKYEIKFIDRKTEMLVHIPLSGHSEIKEEKYEYCVNCE